jgi:tetratricopeptide (TPR) repeat protein
MKGRFFLALLALAMLCTFVLAQENSAEDWYKKGRELLGGVGNFNEAEKAFDKVIELNSSNAFAWDGKGASLSGMGKYEEAVKAYDRALKLMSDDVFTAGVMQKKAKALENLGRMDEATEVNKRIVKIADEVINNWTNSSDLANLSNAWQFKGDILVEQGRYEEAVLAYDNATKVDPTNILFWNSKAYTLGIELCRFNESLYSYNRALEINPSDGVALKGKAKILDLTGWHDEAIKVYEEALKSYDQIVVKNPNSTKRKVLIGDLLLALGRYNDSLEAYDITLELKPTSYSALIGKGKAFDALGRHEEAVKAYNEGLKDFNLIEETRFGRAGPRVIKGDVFRALGRYEDALVAYDEALELNPRYAGVWYYKGLALNALGRTSEADTAFAKAKDLGYQG